MARRDIRVAVDLFTHPKWLKLERTLGPLACLSLLRLWAFAANHRPDGVLRDMDAADLCSAARWKGPADKLIDGLADLGWLDLDPGPEGGNSAQGRSQVRVYSLHDWAEHQPWVVGSSRRSESAREAALAKHSKYQRSDLRSAEHPHASRSADRSAPSPSPSPYPSPLPSSAAHPQKADDVPGPPRGLGAVCSAWEEKQRTPFVGKPKRTAEELLGAGHSADHVIGAMNEAIRADAAGEADNLFGAWSELASKTALGGTFRWKSRVPKRAEPTRPRNHARPYVPPPLEEESGS